MQTGKAASMKGLIATLMALWNLLRRWLFGRPLASSGVASMPRTFIPATKRRWRAKPPWVRHELIRLRAWSPDLGCRALADVFNRRFEDRGMSVSKSHVADVLRRATVEVMRMRHDGKHRVPRPAGWPWAMPMNRVWAIDLTGKADLTGKQHLMLGLLDH